MEKQIKEAYKILGVERHKSFVNQYDGCDKDEELYDPRKIEKLFLPYDTWRYYDEDEEFDPNELVLDEDSEELCIVVISTLSQKDKESQLVTAIPGVLYPVSHEDKYGYEYFDRVMLCEYFTKKPILKLRKYNKGIKMQTLNNKDIKNYKIDLYDLNNLELSQIETGSLDNYVKALNLIPKF